MVRDPRAGRGRASSTMAGAVRAGVTAGLVVVLIALGGIAYLKVTGKRLPGTPDAGVERVLVIVALPDENGDVVAQAVAAVDLKAQTLRSIDPSRSVAIPGTSYSTLRDTYPFGGGDGVARALAQTSGQAHWSWFVMNEVSLARAFASGASIPVDLEEGMSVFDGERLYEFPRGAVTIRTVSELRAIVNGASYLMPAARERVLRDVAVGAVRLMAAYPGGVSAAVDSGFVESDLRAGEAEGVATRLVGMGSL